MARRRRKGSKSLDPVVQQEMGQEMTPIKLWAEEIAFAKRTFKTYWEKCDKICERYKGESHVNAMDNSRAPEVRRYNVLWSVMQTMQPLVYSVPPKPYVARRYNDNDPVARDASLIIKRGLEFSLEGNELHDAAIDARDDFLLTSRGVIWAKYGPYMKLRRVELKDGEPAPDGFDVDLDEETGQAYYEYEEKVWEECDWEHVHYRDFLHGSAAKWKHVPWVARRVCMTRKQLIERFGDEMGKKPPLTISNKQAGGHRSMSDGDQRDSDEERGLFAKAEVWEIWCKEDKKVRWLCPDYPKAFLDERDDFLELKGFFPCPKPVYGTKTNDSLVPTPDFVLWQDIAIELDDVTHRIKLLTQALRVVGVYDGSAGDILKRLTTQTMDNDMIPVSNWAMFAEKGGIKGAVEFFPIEDVAAVLERMHVARQRLVQELYEITGISDVVRGASDPRETAKAQQIKGEFANKRLGTKQKAMIRMIDEALEIQTEIMSKHYSDETLMLISSASQVLTDAMDKQPNMERIYSALALIRSDTMQQRVKVDERYLVEQSIAEDQEQRGQIIQGISMLLGQAVPFLEQAPAAGPLLGRLLMFAVRGYPLAQSEEFAIQSALDQLLAQPMPQQQEENSGPSAGELQIEQQRVQIEAQRLQLDRMKLDLDAQKMKMEGMLQRAQMMLQHENRQRESELRQDKQVMDAALRFEQIEQQREAVDTQQSAEIIKWMGDSEQKAREVIMKDQREGEKIASQYAAAFAKQRESRKEAA